VEDLVALVIFGSYIRGEPTERSDLDLFVVVKNLSDHIMPRRFLVYVNLIRLRRELEADINMFEAGPEEVVASRNSPQGCALSRVKFVEDSVRRVWQNLRNRYILKKE